MVGRSRRRVGFTLVELMVATGLMMVLGLMLIATLRASVSIVSTGTSRGEAWVDAQSILARVEDDLTQLHSASSDGRLVSGKDPNGRPFLVFTRALPEERVYASGVFAAQQPNDASRRNGYTRVWRGRSADDAYRAQGGIAAVAYVFEDTPDGTTLYRGIMAPIASTRLALNGGSASNDLFDDLQQWHLLSGNGRAPYPARLDFGATYELFAPRVLYLGVEFPDATILDPDGQPIWRQHWESRPRSSLRGDLQRSGQWPAQARPRTMDNAVKRGGIIIPNKTSDPLFWQLPTQLGMGFPDAARITVTLAQKAPLDADNFLAVALNPLDTTITLVDAARFSQALDGEQNLVLIESEWVRFGALAGNTLTECERGVRGTTAKAHDGGARVRQGLTLSKIVRMPKG